MSSGGAGQAAGDAVEEEAEAELELLGEDEPPVAITWPWPGAAAVVTDAFGQTETVQARDGQIELKAGVTPVYITEPGG
jgi:hypothetical protein